MLHPHYNCWVIERKGPLNIDPAMCQDVPRYIKIKTCARGISVNAELIADMGSPKEKIITLPYLHISKTTIVGKSSAIGPCSTPVIPSSNLT